MKIKRKIPAFTMIDVLTGMVIMSIIIAMVFYLFTALNKQVYHYGQFHNQLNNYLMLKTDIDRQTDMANEIVGVPNGFQINNERESIVYQRAENRLLRLTDYTTDTLAHELESMQLFYVADNNGKPTELVNEIELKINLQNQVLTCHFYKNYGLMNQMNVALLNEF